MPISVGFATVFLSCTRIAFAAALAAVDSKEEVVVYLFIIVAMVTTGIEELLYCFGSDDLEIGFHQFASAADCLLLISITVTMIMTAGVGAWPLAAAVATILTLTWLCTWGVRRTFDQIMEWRLRLLRKGLLLTLPLGALATIIWYAARVAHISPILVIFAVVAIPYLFLASRRLAQLRYVRDMS